MLHVWLWHPPKQVMSGLQTLLLRLLDENFDSRSFDEFLLLFFTRNWTKKQKLLYGKTALVFTAYKGKVQVGEWGMRKNKGV